MKPGLKLLESARVRLPLTIGLTDLTIFKNSYNFQSQTTFGDFNLYKWRLVWNKTENHFLCDPLFSYNAGKHGGTNEMQSSVSEML